MSSITNKQMVMLLIITLACYSIIVLPKDMALSAGTGSWLTLTVAALIFGVAAVIIVSLNSMFQGKMLFDYAPSLVGKPLTYIIVFFYIIYFMAILVFLITMKARLLKDDFFPNTPLWSFPLIGIPVFCYIANKGITNAGRLSELVGIVFITSALFVHILMFTQGKISRIQPFFNAGDIENYAIGLKDTIFPFLGIEVLLAVPLTKVNGKKVKRTAFLTVLFVGLFYIVVVESSIMKVGINDIAHYDDALIVAIRDTSPEFMDIFTRLDILYLTIGFGAIFVGISIVMAVTVEYLCKIFKKAKRSLITTVVGVLAYIQFFVFKDLRHYHEYAADACSYLGLVAAILIPSVLWLIARKKTKRVKGKKRAA